MNIKADLSSSKRRMILRRSKRSSSNSKRLDRGASHSSPLFIDIMPTHRCSVESSICPRQLQKVQVLSLYPPRKLVPPPLRIGILRAQPRFTPRPLLEPWSFSNPKTFSLRSAENCRQAALDSNLTHLSCRKVAVVVDPRLPGNLRPHQVDGVRFMFECIMGLRAFKGSGCILADDMYDSASC